MTFHDRPLPGLARYRAWALRRNARWSRVVSFSIIGAICTVAFAVIYNLIRTFTGPIEANLLAFGLTMVGNFAANRRFTFQARTGPLTGQAARYALVYVFGLVVSTAVLDLGLIIVAQPGRAIETMIALASGIVATVIRFVLLNTWVFRASLAERQPPVLVTVEAESSGDR